MKLLIALWFFVGVAVGMLAHHFDTRPLTGCVTIKGEKGTGGGGDGGDGIFCRNGLIIKPGLPGGTGRP